MPISKKNFDALKQSIGLENTLVAVSKTKSTKEILEIYNFGQRDFGENKVQELCEKQQELPKDIKWHMIGHLQTNKVKYIAPFVYLIHSVDSVKLLEEINKQAGKIDRKINILLQVHIAEEDNKFGFSQKELDNILQDNFANQYPSIEVLGLMGMATFTHEQKKISSEFKSLKNTFDNIKTKFLFLKKFTVVSMGMSGDYKIALECGSNMVRIGGLIFGERN